MRLAIAVLLAASALRQDPPAFKEENKPENLQALGETLIRLFKAKDVKAYCAQARLLEGTPERAGKALRDDLPADLRARITKLYVPKTLTDERYIEGGGLDPAVATAKVASMTTEELVKFDGTGAAADFFDKHDALVAKEYFKPATVFFGMRLYTADGKPARRYNPVFWDGEHWTELGPFIYLHIYRRDQEKNHPPDPAKALARAKTTSTQALLNQIDNAMQMYWLDKNDFPPSGNVELVKALRGDRVYFEFAANRLNAKGEVIDAWGNPLTYVNGKDRKPPDPKKYDLYSPGPDGKDDQGGGDDVRLIK